ncbi:MAG: hypothetical protein NC305_13395 [Lachnospiraceae bacterium]|nr:hypothetical protein [Butyrivibrio sp.]MCM1344007.1 hypothetical protein [Muribaculaceae bacterium]MCM1411526.1 hypothetical protein [Lachnospiraceae bacterium]
MWKEIIITALAALALTLLAIAIRRALEVLNNLLVIKKAEAEAAGNRSASEAYGMAITVLDSIAEITVSRIEATQAATVRKAVKSGEKPFTELTRCSEEAYQDILGQLSPYVMAALETCVGNTERLIRNKIEEVLPRVKTDYRLLEDKTETLFLEINAAGGTQ